MVANIHWWILGNAVGVCLIPTHYNSLMNVTVEFDVDHDPVMNATFPNIPLLPTEFWFCTFSSNYSRALLSTRLSLQFEQGSQSHSFQEKRKAISSHNSLIDCLAFRWILTQHELFTTLSSVFGPLFEMHGVPMLETACHNVATWYRSYFLSSPSLC